IPHDGQRLPVSVRKLHGGNPNWRCVPRREASGVSQRAVPSKTSSVTPNPNSAARQYQAMRGPCASLSSGTRGGEYRSVVAGGKVISGFSGEALASIESRVEIGKLPGHHPACLGGAMPASYHSSSLKILFSGCRRYATAAGKKDT